MLFPVPYSSMSMVNEIAEERGVQRGMKKGEDRLAALVSRLMAQGRGDDVVRAACDPHVRAKHLQESDLDH